MFNLNPDPIPDYEIERMDSLWFEYERKVLSGSEVWESQHPEVVPRTKAETVHAWTAWAEKNISELTRRT